jgi:hypothetical protein
MIEIHWPRIRRSIRAVSNLILGCAVVLIWGPTEYLQLGIDLLMLAIVLGISVVFADIIGYWLSRRRSTG